MPIFKPYIFSCPKCHAQILGKTIRTDAIYYTKLYSDGKMMCDGLIAAEQQLVLCPSCAHSYWITEDTKRTDPDEIQDKSLVYPVRSWYLFGADARVTEGVVALINHCHEMLALMKPYTNEQEIYLRKLLLWAYNDLVRDRETKPALQLARPLLFFRERKERIKRLFLFKKMQDEHVSNIVRLIGLLKVHENKDISLATIAELYREKGNFEKCKELLNKTNRSTHYVSTIYERASQKCRLVFKVAG
jgi:hypothetical protein